VEPDRLTTVTEFSQYLDTKTINSPEKQQPVLKLLSASPPEGETIANDSNSELREFKEIERMASGEIQTETQDNHLQVAE